MQQECHIRNTGCERVASLQKAACEAFCFFSELLFWFCVTQMPMQSTQRMHVETIVQGTQNPGVQSIKNKKRTSTGHL